MLKDPNQNRLQVKIPLSKKIEFINMGKTNNLKDSELLVYLINNSLLLEVDNLKFFRKSLRNRVSKGIGLDFYKELEKLKQDLEIYTKLL